MGSLAAASMESYQRTYPFLLKLHALRDLEHSRDLADAADDDDKRDLVARWCWDERLRTTTPALRIREPLLAVQRAAYGMHGLPTLEAGAWLKTAKLARAAGHFPTASSTLLHATTLGATDAPIATAKLYYAKGETWRALEELEPVDVDTEALKELAATMTPDAKRLAAKRLVLATEWLQESGHKHGKEVIERYRAVTSLQPGWEKGYFCLGKYHDTLLKRMRDRDRASHSRAAGGVVSLEKYGLTVIQCFGESLRHGHKYIFQSLPRMLTVWLDFASRGASSSSSSSSSRSAATAVATMHRVMNDLVSKLPAYEWMTAFPQIISRVCHRSREVQAVITDICANIMRVYPDRAIWPIMGLYKSLNATRQKRAEGIIKVLLDALVEPRRSEVIDTINGTAALFRVFIDTAKAYTDAPTVQLSSRPNRVSYSLVVPVQSALTVMLPAEGPSAPPDDAFPRTTEYVRGVGQEAQVMVSKEKPKKITIESHSRTSFAFLCKWERKGDLRKDARMMEFNTTINRLLQKSPDSRRRKLRLRTYAVVCLNEECGLMEWVNGTSSFRSLVSGVYQRIGHQDPVRLTKLQRKPLTYVQKEMDGRTRGARYRAEILSNFPAVFHKWFVTTFQDPTQWFESRVVFARSAAVWSMVGHIVGLGDRHGENILIDTSNAECVHVDFDCLFDKGLRLDRPEVVPFRLSPNMVDAFGLSGYEGVFRRVGEVTMGLLRENKETLVSVLEPFVYDPLVEWNRHARRGDSSRSDGDGETRNEEGVKILRKIGDRLDGYYNYGTTSSADDVELASTPLSIRGQVDKLIKEATCDENLSAMYIGWMPFL